LIRNYIKIFIVNEDKKFLILNKNFSSNNDRTNQISNDNFQDELLNESQQQIYISEEFNSTLNKITYLEKTETTNEIDVSANSINSSSDIPIEVSFVDECIETCNLTDENFYKDSYDIIFELSEGVTVNIKQIKYSWSWLTEEKDKNIVELKDKYGSYVGEIKILKDEKTEDSKNVYYNLLAKRNESSVLIKKIKSYDGMRLNIWIDDYSGKQPSNVKINTPIVVFNDSDIEFESSEIVLPKYGDTNVIMHCKDWDYSSFNCNLWEQYDAKLSNQNSTHIWFAVEEFSGWGAGGLTCDEGTLDDNCIINTTVIITNGGSINGTGNLIIKNNGSLTANVGSRFEINISGYVKIEAKGNITGNVNITTSNLTIESGAKIDVTEKGHSEGKGIGTTSCGGGAGYGGRGGSENVIYYSTGGIAYGNVTHPTDLGSGAAGSSSYCDGRESSGGGAVFINVTDTLELNGSIIAEGGWGTRYTGGSSGGSVFIITHNFKGNGTISVNGGIGGERGGGGGGGGRIAIYYFSKTFNGTIKAFGGYGGVYGDHYGGAGTIYLKDNMLGNTTLIIDNNNNFGESTPMMEDMSFYNNTNTLQIVNKGILEIPSGKTLYLNFSSWDLYNGGLIIVGNFSIPYMTELNISHANGTLIYNRSIDFSNITLTSYGTIESRTLGEMLVKKIILKSESTFTHTANKNIKVYSINITTSNLTIESGAKIDVTEKGHSEGKGIGTTSCGGGAGYGGRGGSENVIYYSTGGIAYGNVTHPTDLGSGAAGSSSYCDGRESSGGGAVFINVTDTLELNGSIIAEGGWGTRYTGGSSGGSVFIITHNFKGNGTISVNGGIGGERDGGGGGGGRIAIYYSVNLSSVLFYYSGGTGKYQNGEKGSFYFAQESTSAYLDDYIVNPNQEITVYGKTSICGYLTNNTLTNYYICLEDSFQNENISIWVDNINIANTTSNSTGDYNYTFSITDLGTHPVTTKLIRTNIGYTTSFDTRNLSFDSFNLMDSQQQLDNILFFNEPYNLTVRIREYNGSDYFGVENGNFMLNTTAEYNLDYYKNYTWKTNSTYGNAPFEMGTFSLLANVSGQSDNGISGFSLNINYTYYVKNISIELNLSPSVVNPNSYVNVFGNVKILPDNEKLSNHIINLYLNDTQIFWSSEEPWWNNTWKYRKQINFSEPVGLSRQNTHVRVNLSIDGEMTNENKTALICNDTRFPFDGYALSTSNDYVTVLEGLAEINITAYENKTCWLYYGNENGDELLPKVNGWFYVVNSTATGTMYGYLTPRNITCSGYDQDGEYTIDPCPGQDEDYYKINEWCYFKSNTTGNETFTSHSDDYARILIEGNQITNSWYGTVSSGKHNMTTGHYYFVEVNYAENFGGQYLNIRYNGTYSTGKQTNELCYPFLGGEWLINYTVGRYENLTTNSTGDYSITIIAPEIEGNYIIKVNTTYSGIYGEQTKVLTVGETQTVRIENISIEPDEGDPGILINPIENSLKKVNVTVIASNSTKIEICEIRIFNSTTNYSNPVFQFDDGIIQNCNETACECFKEWDMDYWRNAGDWNVSVYINITNGASDIISENFTFNYLTSITVNTTTIVFTGYPGQTVNSTNAYPLEIKNTGNQITDVNINGTDFVGLTNSNFIVGIGNATYNDTIDGDFKQLRHDPIKIFSGIVPSEAKNVYFRAYLPVGFISQDYQNYIEIVT